MKSPIPGELKTRDPYPETCVLEFNPTGHHLAYAGILVRFLWEKTGQKPLFLTSAGVPESKGYETHLKPMENLFEVQAAARVKAGKGWQMWKQIFPVLGLLKKLRGRGIARVLAPTGDELAVMLGLARLFGFKLKNLEIRCGLILLPLAYPTPSGLRRLKRRLFLWLQMKSGAKLLCYDLYAVEILRRDFHIALDTLPEPLLSMGSHPPAPSDPSREVLYLGAIGYFDPRKGVDLLLEAFRRARFNRPVKLLLAGMINDPALARIIEDSGLEGDRLQVVNKILSNEEYAAVFEKMDILCMPYRSHVGPSGVYAQAAAQGKVIVASDYGWLGWEGKKYNKIAFFKDQSPNSLVECLEQTVGKFDSLRGLAGNYEPITEKDFTKVFCDF